MLSLKIGRCLSRCLPAVVSRVPERVSNASLPMCSRANTALTHRRYSNDDKDDKFVESDKYKVFRDDESSVILDVEEERALLESRLDDRSSDLDEDRDQFFGLNTSRGVSGVYEVEHLVEVLQKNNASNIFVVTIPSNIRYVDYIVIASGKSRKHLQSIAEFTLKLYKKKRNPTDKVPKLINKKPTEWIALDIGNIALHLLTKEVRKDFDLETIWSVGEKFDTHLNRPEDSLVQLLDEHSFSLQHLEPIDVNNVKTQ